MLKWFADVIEHDGLVLDAFYADDEKRAWYSERLDRLDPQAARRASDNREYWQGFGEGAADVWGRIREEVEG